MSKEETKRSVIVGLFVFIGLAILIAGVIVLGSQQKKFSKTIEVKTTFHDVNGLKVGSNIWFSGVKIGIIKSINFESIEDVEVVMTIDQKSAEFIRKDAMTKLSSDGLIGNRIIVIVGGSQTAAGIQQGDFLTSAKATDVEDMMATLQVNNENLVKITTDFVTISHNIAQGKGVVGAMLTDSTLVQSLNSVSQTMSHANAASMNLVSLSNKLNSNSGLIHDLSTDTEVFASLRESAAQLQGVTQTANALMSNLNAASQKLNAKDNAVGALLNDPASAEQIKEILNNLNSSSEKLDENMKALQSNFLFKGYFKKKAKEEASQKAP